MTSAQTKVLAELLKPGRLVPCTITQTSPLLVTMQGASSIPGEKLAGLTYNTSSTDNAYALINSPGKPIILPIG